jgi:hypothetical protein
LCKIIPKPLHFAFTAISLPLENLVRPELAQKLKITIQRDIKIQSRPPFSVLGFRLHDAVLIQRGETLGALIRVCDPMWIFKEQVEIHAYFVLGIRYVIRCHESVDKKVIADRSLFFPFCLELARHEVHHLDRWCVDSSPSGLAPAINTVE